MSNDDRPEFVALSELRLVLGHLTEELASWRRRALKAEGDRSAMGADHDAVAARRRIVELERENAELGRRVDAARERVRELLARLKFLEEQVAMEQHQR